jgi:hypothetical protein
VNTKIRKVEENPTLFPMVTLCSRNFFTTYEGYEFLKNYTAEYNFTDIFTSDAFGTRHAVTDAVFYASIKTLNLTNDERRKFGFPLQDILVECRFDYFDCTIDDFTPIYDKTYGNCFAFNSGRNSSNHKVKLKTSSYVGKKGGLSITLKVKLDENLKNVYSDTGYTIRVDNSSHVTGSDDWIDLLTGFETNLIVDRYYATQLPTPYSRCMVQNDSKYEESELFRLLYYSKYTYI